MLRTPSIQCETLQLVFSIAHLVLTASNTLCNMYEVYIGFKPTHSYYMPEASNYTFVDYNHMI